MLQQPSNATHSSAAVSSTAASVEQMSALVKSLVDEPDAEWSHTMKGIIYPSPPAAHEVQDPTRELSMEALNEKVERGEFEGISMLIEHDPDATKENRVGRVVRAAINPETHNVEIEFRLRKDGNGKDVISRVQRGELAELSLGHVAMTDGPTRVLEVSLVNRGARPGCKIIRASARLSGGPGASAAAAAATAAASATAAAAAAPKATAAAPVHMEDAVAVQPTAAVAPVTAAVDENAASFAASFYRTLQQRPPPQQQQQQLPPPAVVVTASGSGSQSQQGVSAPAPATAAAAAPAPAAGVVTTAAAAAAAAAGDVPVVQQHGGASATAATAAAATTVMSMDTTPVLNAGAPAPAAAPAAQQTAPLAAAAAPAATQPVAQSQVQLAQIQVGRDESGRFTTPAAAVLAQQQQQPPAVGTKRSAADADLGSANATDAKRAEPDAQQQQQQSAPSGGGFTAQMIETMAKITSDIIAREQKRAEQSAAAAQALLQIPIQQQQQQIPAQQQQPPQQQQQQRTLSDEERAELMRLRAERDAERNAQSEEGLKRLRALFEASGASSDEPSAAITRQIVQWMATDDFKKSPAGQAMLAQASKLPPRVPAALKTEQPAAAAAAAVQQQLPVQQQQQLPVQQPVVPVGFHSKASMGGVTPLAMPPPTAQISATPMSKHREAVEAYTRQVAREEAYAFERAMRMSGVPIDVVPFGMPAPPPPSGGFRVCASAAATQQRINPIEEIVMSAFDDIHKRLKSIDVTSSRLKNIGRDDRGLPVVGWM